MDEAARRSGVSTGRLRQLLTTDSTAWVARNGSLFYVDPASHRAQAGATTATGTSGALPMTLPAAQTFTLHSRPGATRTIFLDMDGATLPKNNWSYNGLTVTSVPGINGAAAFTSTQEAWVQEVWRQVSEAYAPFDVDVTTQDPGPAGYTMATLADPSYGTHVVITPPAASAAQAQLCQGVACLGMAMVGTFDTVDPTGAYQPAWVFADSTTNATIAAQGAAHEAGHTLGLSHDGTNTGGAGSYYGGTPFGWGPIMGFATNRSLSQWSKGEYADANEHQDDLAVIADHGAPLRSDDHGDTTATADQLGSAASYTAGGVVSTRTDVDVFAVDRACTSTFTASAKGIGAQTALDVSLKLSDSSGTQIALDSPVSGHTAVMWPVSTGMNAAISTSLGAGRYYLTVDGVGSGSAYSDYASLGQYTLTMTGCPAVTPSPSPTTSPSSSPTTGPSSSPSATPTPPTPTVTVTAPTTPTPTSTSTPTVAPATRPGPPRIGLAYSGTSGGAVTAQARWAAPTSTGGTPITRYRVAAKKLDSRNRTIATYYASSYSSASARVLNLRLPRGRYVFVVRAWNAVGYSNYSANSRIVTAR